MLAELGTAPVAVTSIAGLYRTGKSFLSNALCDRIGAGFTVGRQSKDGRERQGDGDGDAPPAAADAPVEVAV